MRGTCPKPVGTPACSPGVEGRPPWLRECAYRRDRYQVGLPLLRQALGHLEATLERAAPGARGTVAYLAFRTRLYIGHLETVGHLLGAHLAYDEAFRAKQQGDGARFSRLLDGFEKGYGQGLALARRTTAALAEGSGNETDRYLLFRYSVLWLRPLEAFAAFVGNVCRFHRGEPYWDRVDWSAIEIARLPYENV